MAVWESIVKQNGIVMTVLKNVSRFEYKMRSQIINANDSVRSNFVEGYYSGYIKEYIRFLKYSRRSGEELHERVKSLYELELIEEELFQQFETRNRKTNYLIDRTRQSLELKDD